MRASWLYTESLRTFFVGEAADGGFIYLVKGNKDPNFEPIFQELGLSPTLYSELDYRWGLRLANDTNHPRRSAPLPAAFYAWDS